MLLLSFTRGRADRRFSLPLSSPSENGYDSEKEAATIELTEGERQE
jgi:hypothetical protein